MSEVVLELKVGTGLAVEGAVAALVIVLRLGSRARVEQSSAPRQVIATQAFD
jgi:hypothetical protein